jgi:hypothetical protein
VLGEKRLSMLIAKEYACSCCDLSEYAAYATLPSRSEREAKTKSSNVEQDFSGTFRRSNVEQDFAGTFGISN